jgi:hypothetical protein
MSKDFRVVVTYDVEHKDTYLITGVANEEEAIEIAENQNLASNCFSEKEEDNIEERDENSVATEVVFSSEEKDWIKIKKFDFSKE